MKTILDSRRHHYVVRVSIFLITVALIAGMVGCNGVEYDLTISSTAGGSVTTPGEAGPYTYDEGEVVNLVAEPDEGYRFENWTGDVDTIDDVDAPSTTITMNDNYSITANFVAQYVLTIDSTDGGEVTTPGEGIFNYDEGTDIDLVAVDDEGYQFINWTGDVSTIADVNAASTTITMNSGYSITANFAGAIQDWYDLDAIRDNLDGSYILINNLDSTSAGYVELAGSMANGGKGWEPIGGLFVDPVHDYIVDPVDLFTGNLDGQEYEITDLFINRPDEDGVGLFSCVGGGNVIENLGVVNAKVIGHIYVGSLVGCAFWGSTVSDSYSTGSVTGSNNYVGGLIGHNWNAGTINYSYSSADVTGIEDVGGLVGDNDGTVSNSYSTGSVTGNGQVGGLVGDNSDGTVSDCYATGSVTGKWHVGGLVGGNENTVSNSYSTGIVTGDTYVGGLVGVNRATISNSFWDIETSGQSTSASGTGKTTAEMMDIATFTDAGWNIIAVANPNTRDSSYIWNIVDGETYPFLSWQPVS